MNVRSFVQRFAGATAVLILFTSGMLAQGATGIITGTVTDETGAVLPGASVTIRNDDTAAARDLATDADGRFRAPDLLPGPYSVTATLQGFATIARSGIRLTIGREAVVDFSLKVGQIADVVNVVGEASTIDTRTSSTGALISEEQIKNLPLNGRSFIELATLTPGVQLTSGGGRNTSAGFGQKISVNGARYTQNLFTLDGTMMNDQFNQAGSATGNMLGVEAIREFQVLTNSFSAEYGRHTGAVVNAATKTGTNSFRGSLFEFHRNEALDANRWEAENNNLAKPDFQRNQFGFSLGGPIMRERTFFFTNYEGLRETLGVTRTFNVPSLAVRASAGPLVRPFLNAYPEPNSVVLDAQRGQYIRQDQRDTAEHYFVTRLDHRFSTNQSMFGRYTFNDGEVTDPERVNTGAITKTRLQFMTVEHQAVRGAGLVNRLQFGYTSSRLDGFDYVLDGITFPRTTFTDVDRGIGTIAVSGLNDWGGSTTNPKFHEFSNIQLSDSVSWTRGAHNLRLGGHMEYQRYDLTSDFTTMGSFVFASINTLLAGTPRTFDAVQPGSDTSRRLRQYVFGVFVQDDWQIRSNLTLNLGVRYEPTSDITEVDGKLAQLIDFASPTASGADTTVVDAVVKNPSYRNFAPRAGFAWDVAGNGKTSLRGGTGIFYDLLTANTNFVQNTAVRVTPFFQRSRISSTGSAPIDFPEAYFTQAARLAGNAQLEGIQYEPDQPTMVKWNLNVQRALLERTSIEVGYTGTRGSNLFRQIYTNGREAIEVDGRLFVPAGTPLRQPNFGRMRLRVSDAESWYNGLTVGLTRRDPSLQTQVSYTLGKSEDTGASAIGGNDYDNEAGGSRYLFSEDKGLSPFDVRHSFVVSANWEVPFGRGPGVVSALIRDWSVGGLIRLKSGSPFSVQNGPGLERGRQPDAPDYPDLCPGANPNPVLGGATQYFDPTAFCLQPAGFIGNAPRNSVIGPGFATVDLILARGIELGGTREVQIRVEAFNILNRANFAFPTAQLFNTDGTYRSDAGRITSTVGTPRQIQLGAKIVW
ncbi:MAG: TonB-dependent receptor [Acidobacteria bacterium]|nr:TonB-dependent receptor [Acidobacteriota bacterium]